MCEHSYTPRAVKLLNLINRPRGSPSVSHQPLLYCVDDKVQVNFSLPALLGSLWIPRSVDAPSLSAAQSHALARFLEVATSTAIKVEQTAGDLLFINNLSIIHARSAYTNISNTAPPRHLLRLFLRDPERAWKLHPSYREKVDRRFQCPSEKQHIPVTLEEERSLIPTEEADRCMPSLKYGHG